MIRTKALRISASGSSTSVVPTPAAPPALVETAGTRNGSSILSAGSAIKPLTPRGSQIAASPAGPVQPPPRPVPSDPRKAYADAQGTAATRSAGAPLEALRLPSLSLHLTTYLLSLMIGALTAMSVKPPGRNSNIVRPLESCKGSLPTLSYLSTTAQYPLGPTARRKSFGDSAGLLKRTEVVAASGVT
jgi:hypothetical protein